MSRSMEVDEFTDRLTEVVRTQIGHDEDLASGLRPDQVQAAAEAVIERLEYLAGVRRVNERIGPFYSTERVRTVLGGVSRQAVSDRVRKHRLLRVDSADGDHLYPAFQFRDGRMLTGLPELLKVLLGSGEDGWTVAYWLTARTEYTDGLNALEVLASGRDDLKADLFRLARNDAAGWADAA